MTLVSANFNKYRAWTFLFGAVCILIMPLVMFMMWWLRDFPLGSASFLVYFLAPFALGMTVSRVELATMRAPMVWCLPGQLQGVRTLIVRLGLVVCAPMLLCLSQRAEPLSILQFASISFANLFFYCLGLIPRIFPRLASRYWSTVVLAGMGITYLSKGAAPVMLADLILEMPIPMMALSVVLCVFCWNRLGDRTRIHAFLQSRHLSESAHAVAPMHGAHQPALAPAEERGWAYRTERRMLGWLIERVKKRTPGNWKGSVVGVLLHASDAQVLRTTLRIGLFATIMFFMTYAGTYPLGARILHAVVALPLIPMLLIVIVGWDELCRRQQAVLLLPLSRREFLRVRWALLAAILGVGIFAVVSQLIVTLSVQAFLIEGIDGESAHPFRPWRWVTWFLLATVAPALAGLGLSLPDDDPISSAFAILITLIAGAVICALVAILYSLPPGWLQLCLGLGVAGIWSWSISVVRRCTLKKDVYV